MIETKKTSIKAKPLGPLVARVIARQDLKQNELSKEVGMTPSQISNYLSGQKDIRSGTFVSLLRFLGIDIAKLLKSEAGASSSFEDNLESQLQILPSLERETLSEFLRVFQHRYMEEKIVNRQKANPNA